MNTPLKKFVLAFALLALPVHAEEEPKTPPPIAQDAKHPRGVNVKLMSEDPTYGYAEKNPVKVGSRDEYGGPQAERDYLDSLVDACPLSRSPGRPRGSFPKIPPRRVGRGLAG